MFKTFIGYAFIAFDELTKRFLFYKTFDIQGSCSLELGHDGPQCGFWCSFGICSCMYSLCNSNTQLLGLSLPWNQSKARMNLKHMLTTLSLKSWFVCLIRIFRFKNFTAEGTTVSLI